MPLYEYRCPNCGTTLEKLLPVGNSIVYCSICMSNGKQILMQKLISIPGPRWKFMDSKKDFT